MWIIFLSGIYLLLNLNFFNKKGENMDSQIVCWKVSRTHGNKYLILLLYRYLFWSLSYPGWITSYVVPGINDFLCHTRDQSLPMSCSGSMTSYVVAEINVFLCRALDQCGTSITTISVLFHFSTNWYTPGPHIVEDKTCFKYG